MNVKCVAAWQIHWLQPCVFISLLCWYCPPHSPLTVPLLSNHLPEYKWTQMSCIHKDSMYICFLSPASRRTASWIRLWTSAQRLVRWCTGSPSWIHSHRGRWSGPGNRNPKHRTFKRGERKTLRLFSVTTNHRQPVTDRQKPRHHHPRSSE